MVTTTTGLATDFITFSRTSNATVTGADGKIKWAGHNLLTNSESFDASSWSKTNSGSVNPVVTANAVAAPNGTTTADQIALGATSSSGNFSVVGGVAATTAVDHTFSVWLRTVSGTATVYIQAFGSAYSTAVACSLTTTWQLFSVTFTGASGNSYFNIGPDARTGSGQPTSQSAATIYAWGAHLYRSDLGGMVLNPARGDAYYPTTPRNLLGYTEDFSAGWTATRVAVSANQTVAPNGLQTADLVSINTTANSSLIHSTLATIGNGPRTGSVYLKQGTWRYMNVVVQDFSNNTRWAAATVDLQTGLITQTTNGAGASAVTSSSAPAENGFYRVSITATLPSSTIAAIEVSFSPDATPSLGGGGRANVTGTAADYVYLWGAQLSDSASLDAYSPVYGAAVTSAAYYAPRLDYDANGSALGLLVEEQRVNLLTHTAAFDNGDWTKSGTASITADTTVAPDGTTTADTLTGATGDPAVAVTDTLARTPTVSPSTAYTASIYVRGIAGTTVKLLLRDGSTGVTASTTATLTSSWQRISCTLTSGASTTAFSYRVGSINGTIAIWGAQFEAGSFATSYIPNGSAVAGATRTADVASVSTQAFPYSASEGTVVANVSVLSVANTNGAQLWSFYTDSNNFTRAWIWDGAKTTPRGNVTIAGSGVVDLTGGTVSANQVFKTAMAAKQDDFAYSLNGGTVATDTGGAMPTASASMHLGSLGGLASTFLNGHIRQITYLPRRITNAELQARTV